MATTVRYKGNSDARVVRNTDFAAAGLTQGTLSFDRSNAFKQSVDSVTAAFLVAQGDFVLDSAPTATFADALAATLAPRSSLSPVKQRKSDANISLSVIGTWTDVDPSGTGVSRTYDVVIPNVAVGQFVQYVPSFVLTSAASACYFDVMSIVAGAAVNRHGTSAAGVSAWLVDSNVLNGPKNAVMFGPLQAGDIEGGSVRLRLRYLIPAGSARTVAAAGGFIWDQDGRGPF